MSNERARVGRAPATETEKIVLTIACAAAFGYAVSLAMMFANHLWILDSDGRPILDDFVVFWASGQMALKGATLAVYNAYSLHAAEAASIGHNFSGWLVWPYPPLFLLVVTPLARLPYGLAFILWCTTTLALYASVAAAIAERRIAFVVACAMPWVWRTLLIGQNGLLSSAIIGVVLLNVEKRPVLSGLVLGLLSYKPQFGILFPLALAAGGYWRAFAWAAVGTLAWNGLAAAVFGPATFDAFLQSLPVKTNTDLVHNALGWSKFQSVYGLSRFLGLPTLMAWIAQAAASLGIATSVWLCWRSAAPFPLKAALLAAAVVLVTPFIFVDDLPILAVAVAFLFRHRAFDRFEVALMAVTAPFVFLSVGLPIPLGILAGFALMVISARRLYDVAVPRGLISPSWLTEATSVPSSE